MLTVRRVLGTAIIVTLALSGITVFLAPGAAAIVPTQQPPTCASAEDGSGQTLFTTAEVRVGQTDSAAVGDLNQDGVKELVTVGQLKDTSGNLHPIITIWKLTGTGSSCTIQRLDTISWTGRRAPMGSLESVVIGNFYYGDSKPEIVAVGSKTNGAIGLIAAVSWSGPGSYTTKTVGYGPFGATDTDLRAVIAGDIDRDTRLEFIFAGKTTWSSSPNRRSVVAYGYLDSSLTPVIQSEWVIDAPDGNTLIPNEANALAFLDSGKPGFTETWLVGHYLDSITGTEWGFVLEIGVPPGDGNQLSIALCDNAEKCIVRWHYATTWNTLPSSAHVSVWPHATVAVAVGYGATPYSDWVPGNSAIRLFASDLADLGEYDAANSFRTFNSIGVRDSDLNGDIDEFVAVGTYRAQANNDDAGYVVLAWTPPPLFGTSNPTLKYENSWSGGDLYEGAHGLVAVDLVGTTKADFVVAADIWNNALGRYTGQVGVFAEFAAPQVRFLDNFDNDCNISPWSVSKGGLNIVEVRSTRSYSAPCSLFVSYLGRDGAARATTPAISFDRTKDYVISLKFFVSSTRSDRYVVAMDDSRAIVDYSFGVLYAGFFASGMPITAIGIDSWHTIELQVHPASSNYQVLVDGILYGPFAFYAAGTAMTLSVGSRSAPSSREYCDAYFDDVKLVQ